MSVAECQQRISSAEFAEWIAFAQVDGPWWAERGDLQAGIVASTLANIHSRKGRRYTARDFMPYRDASPKREQSIADMRAVMSAFTAAHNGSVSRDRRR